MTTAIADAPDDVNSLPTPESPAAPPAAVPPTWRVRRAAKERVTLPGADLALQLELTTGNPADRAAQVEALAWTPFAEALRSHFSFGPAVTEYRRLARTLEQVRQDFAALERKVRRAELDREDALASQGGEKLARALSKADAAAEEATGRLAEASRGLKLLEKRTAEAAARVRRENEEELSRLDAAAMDDVARQLAARRKDVQAALVEVAGPLLSELLALFLAQESIVQAGVKRREKTAALLAEAAAGDTETAAALAS